MHELRPQIHELRQHHFLILRLDDRREYRREPDPPGPVVMTTDEVRDVSMLAPWDEAKGPQRLFPDHALKIVMRVERADKAAASA